METLQLFRNATDARAFKAGETVFHEGEPGDVAYVVQDGEVEIQVRGRVVERVGPGGILGEMALIDHKPRSATAIAHGDTRLVPIDEQRFLFLVQQTPFFSLHLMRVMAERIRRVDQQL